jgi:hypothetical protein
MPHVYRINLNKGEDKQARIAQQLEMQRWFLLGILVLAAAGLSGLTWHYNARLDGMIASKEADIQRVTEELQELRDTGSKLSKADILNLAQLERSRLLWTEKLQGLGMEVTRDMALTSVRYEKNYLYIDGIHKVREHQDPVDLVMQLVEQLRANGLFNQDFESVNFAASEDIISHDQRALRFEIQCKILPRFQSKTVNFGRDA